MTIAVLLCWPVTRCPSVECGYTPPVGPSRARRRAATPGRVSDCNSFGVRSQP